MNVNLFNFTVDKENNRVNVEREFSAPQAAVWRAWTESELLDKWWAPKPWKTETKSMNFVVGGKWLYAMVGPQGERHWGCFDYQSIDPINFFSCKSAFCDEEGVINESFGASVWANTFSESGGKTLVSIVIQCEGARTIEQMLEMGFKEGFSMGLGNLDDVLASM